MIISHEISIGLGFYVKKTHFSWNFWSWSRTIMNTEQKSNLSLPFSVRSKQSFGTHSCWSCT